MMGLAKVKTVKAAEEKAHGSRETGVAKFDHLDPDEMLDALLELASRVVILEKIIKGDSE